MREHLPERGEARGAASDDGDGAHRGRVVVAGEVVVFVLLVLGDGSRGVAARVGVARAGFPARGGRGVVELAPREPREHRHERHGARQADEHGVDERHRDAREGEKAEEEQREE